MKLWLLKPRDGLGAKWIDHCAPDAEARLRADPWGSLYGNVFGVVARAETEDDARGIAAAEAGHERYAQEGEVINPWLDATLSTCTELTAAGEPGCILRDLLED